jgi:hypothetical protein
MDCPKLNYHWHMGAVWRFSSLAVPVSENASGWDVDGGGTMTTPKIVFKWKNHGITVF